MKRYCISALISGYRQRDLVARRQTDRVRPASPRGSHRRNGYVRRGGKHAYALAENERTPRAGHAVDARRTGHHDRYTSHIHEGALIWQLGYVEYPAQRFHAITNDTNYYGAFSISADGKTLATMNAQFSSELDVIPGAGGEAVAVPGFPKSAAIAGAMWKSDGNLIVASRDHVTATAPDGSHATNLVSDPAAGIDAVALCGSGRYSFIPNIRRRTPWVASSGGRMRMARALNLSRTEKAILARCAQRTASGCTSLTAKTIK